MFERYDYSDYPTWLTNGRYVDLKGKPVEHTPHSHPYSFDEYVIYKSDRYSETDSAVYSDRMLQWDYKKFEACTKEVWNDGRQIFDAASSEDIEKFLQLYFASGVELTAVLKGCNYSNGYPYWIFYYKEVKDR